MEGGQSLEEGAPLGLFRPSAVEARDTCVAAPSALLGSSSHSAFHRTCVTLEKPVPFPETLKMQNVFLPSNVY